MSEQTKNEEISRAADPSEGVERQDLRAVRIETALGITSGTWTARRDDRLEIEAIETFVDGQRLMVAMAHSYRGHIDPAARAANARVMAASPALYAALKALVDRYTTLVNCGDCGSWDAEAEAEVIVARAALARAEGRA
jgi:hypothetical protein